MTTQNTHHEHRDVDNSVVEYPSAAVEPTPDATVPPAENDAEAGVSSPEPTSDATEEEVHTVPSALAETESVPVPSAIEDTTGNLQEVTAIQDTLPDPAPEVLVAPVASAEPIQEASAVSETEHSPEAPVALGTEHNQEASAVSKTEHSPEAVIDPVQEHSEAPIAELDVQVPDTHEQQSFESSVTHDVKPSTSPMAEALAAFSYTEVVPLIDNRAEDVRPFTDFIEEFRQAEAARLQVSLQASHVEAFSLLSPVMKDVTPAQITAEETTTSSASSREDTSPMSSVDTAATTSSQEEASSSASSVAAASSLPESGASTGPTEPVAEVVRPTPPERAVSPLLRPASRLRVPRHNVRHPREEVVPESAISQPKAEQPVQSTLIDTPVAAEAPRPTRRYRFDRPAANAQKASAATVPASAQPRPEDARSATAASASTEATLQASEPAVASTSQAAETQTRKQLATQEVVATESIAPVAPTIPAPEPSRRRHGHKEPPAAAAPIVPPVAEVAPAPIVELSAKPEEKEIAPEDLPPLEYSELQKASSRRRRRHRSGSSASSVVAPIVPSIVSTPVLPVAPLPIPPLAVVAPPVPTPPAPAPQVPGSSAAYTIVSGYTVNQMNQGNDNTGPFMGPDPSPAKGSGFTRDGRIPARSDVQRAPVSGGQSYPLRSSDNGFSSASMTQFANIVSQSIQTQTDRMVAELRRANQAPTNVSVTLPPFPSTERVGVFVDVANLLYSARTLRLAVDFGKLLDFLRGNRRLVRAHAYCPTSPQPGDEQMFLQAVKGLGYRITTKNYKTFSSGAKKADLDLDLCMDVVRLVDGGAVDCIVLVSGDSDFMPMLDYCSDHGVRVEVAAFDEAMSATLRQGCDLFVNLSMLEEIRA